MAGLVPATHVYILVPQEHVDARDKPKHDELRASGAVLVFVAD